MKSKLGIIEVTPRLRKMMAAKNVDWSTATLKKTMLHHRVKIQGWMFFDAIHANAAENTHAKAPYNWRATAWEIHPISDLKFHP